jgi:hypothetical protein
MVNVVALSKVVHEVDGVVHGQPDGDAADQQGE